MAPEQAHGGTIGPPADVWGIGVVLWATACGDTPFGDEAYEYPQLELRAPAVRTKRRLPRDLAEAVDTALDPDPAGRPTIDELRETLIGVAGSRG